MLLDNFNLSNPFLSQKQQYIQKSDYNLLEPGFNQFFLI
jgi:hypothetical protein